MFAGKTVVITGASSGLGAALAEAVAKAGGGLALLARNAERLGAVAESCRAAGARVVEVQGDVVDPGACEGLISAALAELSSIDYLVLNAGVSMWASFEEIEELSLFSKIMDTNYQGSVNCVYHGLAALKESGGLLVAISSIQGLTGVPSHTGYCASKHALLGWCESLRYELAPDGVRVQIVLPPEFDSPMVDQLNVGRSPENLAMVSSIPTLSLDQAALRDYEPELLKHATFGISVEPPGGSPTGQPTGPAIHGYLYPTEPSGGQRL